MITSDFNIYYKVKEKGSVEEQRLYEIIEKLKEITNVDYTLIPSDDISEAGNSNPVCLIKLWLKPGFRSVYDISDILKLADIDEAIRAIGDRIPHFSSVRYAYGYHIDWHTIGNCTYPVAVLDEQFDLFCKDEDTVFFDELDSALEYAINKISTKISDYNKISTKISDYNKIEDIPAINVLTALKSRYEEILIEYYMYKLNGETLQLDEA